MQHIGNDDANIRLGDEYFDLLCAVIWQAKVDAGEIRSREGVKMKHGDDWDACQFLKWCKECFGYE